MLFLDRVFRLVRDGPRGGWLAAHAVWVVLAGWSLLFAATCSATGGTQESAILVLETTAGRIEIELLPDAAPAAVHHLIRLIEGPTFHPDLSENSDGTSTTGYYDGLEFDLAYPHRNITTSLRPPADAVLIPTMIDADALGLDDKKIDDGAEANKVWQFDLFPYQAGVRSEDELHPLMREWLARWGEEQDSDFLIGVSHRQIAEALGYRFTDGLKSRRNTRGMVALDPFDQTRSTPRLVILLADAPHLDGRRMVIGRVVSGLNVVDAIAARPLIPAKAVKNRPMVPVTISSAGLECSGPADQTNESKGAER